MSFRKLGVSPKEFEEHEADTTNPHSVTKSQVGLGSVDNVKQASKEEHDRLAQSVATHLADDATTSKKGHVQLSNSATSTSQTLAATPRAVKTAMDRANEAFTSASNGKQLVGNAITGVDDSIILPTDPTFQQLADLIGNISTGKKVARGTKYAYSSDKVTFGYIFPNPDITGIRYEECGVLPISGLDFVPEFIVVTMSSSFTGSSGNIRYSSYAKDFNFITRQGRRHDMDDGHKGYYISSEGGFNEVPGVYNIPIAYTGFSYNWFAYGD